MRLSPPVTILAIVAVPLIWLSFTWQNSDCYYSPDGKERFSNFIESAASRLKSGPDCDVWKGIIPRKPIETIELEQGTEGGASIVARISPNGSGFVAVVPPYFSSYHPLNSTLDPTLDLYEKYATVFEFSPSNGQAYATIKSLVGPIRDFQGGLFVDSTSADTRRVFELDDPLTRKIKCRKELSILPARHGPLIKFSFADRSEPSLVGTGLNCDDSAQRSAEDRIDRAVAMLIESTGKRDAIRLAASRQYPACEGPQIHEPCWIPIL